MAKFKSIDQMVKAASKKKGEIAKPNDMKGGHNMPKKKKRKSRKGY